MPLAVVCLAVDVLGVGAALQPHGAILITLFIVIEVRSASNTEPSKAR